MSILVPKPILTDGFIPLTKTAIRTHQSTASLDKSQLCTQCHARVRFHDKATGKTHAFCSKKCAEISATSGGGHGGHGGSYSGGSSGGGGGRKSPTGRSPSSSATGGGADSG